MGSTFLEYFQAWGGKFNSLGLDHSGSQPFNYGNINAWGLHGLISAHFKLLLIIVSFLQHTVFSLRPHFMHGSIAFL